MCTFSRYVVFLSFKSFSCFIKVFIHSRVAVHADSLNCPGTIDVTSSGTYCNGELVQQNVGGATTQIVEPTPSSVQVVSLVFGLVSVLLALMH